MWALDWLVCLGKACSQVSLGSGYLGGVVPPESARCLKSKHQKPMINTEVNLGLSLQTLEFMRDGSFPWVYPETRIFSVNQVFEEISPDPQPPN